MVLGLDMRFWLEFGIKFYNYLILKQKIYLALISTFEMCNLSLVAAKAADSPIVFAKPNCTTYGAIYA
jgi:hypothetical protein